MPRTTTQTKTKKAAKPVNTAEQEEQEVEAFPKTKKAVEIDEPEMIPGMEEKLDEDGMPIEDGEESEDDEIGLDDNEDFGDRWEE